MSISKYGKSDNNKNQETDLTFDNSSSFKSSSNNNNNNSSSSSSSGRRGRNDINILVIETNSDIQHLYKSFFGVMAPSHIYYTIVSDIIEKSLEDNHRSSNNNNNNNNSNNNNISDNCSLSLISQSVYDTIIIDISSTDNYKGLGITKEILKNIPNQRIIFTTTTDPDTLKEKIKTDGLSLPSLTIMQKPFKFSDLLSIISPTKNNKFDKVKLTDHVLASYNTIHEELSDAVAFINKGIQNDELSLLLIREDMDITNTTYLLKSKGLLNVDTLIKNGSLIIRKNEDWYIPDGQVDKYRIINQWNHLVKHSIDSDKKGLRAFCMMDCFFDNGFSKEVVDYEITLPSQFSMPFIPICAYRQNDLDMLPEEEKRNLLECHNHLMIG